MSADDTTDRDREVLRRWNRGDSPSNIAADHGLSRAGVYLVARRMGGVDRGALRRARTEQYVEAYVRGEKVKDIAERYGVSPSAVVQAVQRRGLPTRLRRADPCS